MLYEKKKRYARQRTGKLFFVGVCASVALMISLVMLISCQFRFGVLVIATESMSDEINKGDAIVFEQYEDQTIEVGDVIIFERGKSRIVHRVTEIQKVAGQNRYFTKGDANESADIGFITDEDIVGVTCFKIAYVGYPSLWVRDIVSN
jgi:signal peptidase